MNIRILMIAKVLFLTCMAFTQFGCIFHGSGNPTGGYHPPDYPYFITTQPVMVKRIEVPVGTKLTYGEAIGVFTKGAQNKILSEDKLTDISLPEGQSIEWAGVPIRGIHRFFNTELAGFTVQANFDLLTKEKKTKFSERWLSCSEDLGVDVKDINDWSFNKGNISDIRSCSVLYQRYFKEDAKQQKFLDELLLEMHNVVQ